MTGLLSVIALLHLIELFWADDIFYLSEAQCKDCTKSHLSLGYCLLLAISMGVRSMPCVGGLKLLHMRIPMGRIPRFPGTTHHREWK